jgi:hypothetical protein
MGIDTEIIILKALGATCTQADSARDSSTPPSILRVNLGEEVRVRSDGESDGGGVNIFGLGDSFYRFCGVAPGINLIKGPCS